jgi:MFS family permease
MTTQKRALVAIYVISFIFLFYQLTNTTIAYIIDSFPHLPPVSVQQLVSLPAIFGLIVTSIIGPIATKINKKYLTIFCTSMVFIYCAIFAFVGTSSLTPLLVATVFAGIASGSSLTLVSSMIGEFFGSEKSANYVAVALAIMNGGLALVALAGGAIAAGNNGANWPYSYYLGILLVPAIIIFGILMPKKPDDVENDSLAKAPKQGASQAVPAGKEKLPARLIVIAIFAAIYSVFVCGFLFYISVYIVNEYKLGSSVEVGIANSIFTITGLVAGFTYSLWAKLFKKALVVVAFILVTVSLLCMLTFTTTLFGAFAAALFLGLGFNMLNPYIMGFIIQITPPRLVPVGIAIFMIGPNAAMFVAIYVLNFLSGLLGGGLKNVLLVCTVGMAVCTVAAVFVYRTKDVPAQAGA